MVEVSPPRSVDIWMQQYEWVKISGRVVNDNGEPIPAAAIVRQHCLNYEDILSWSDTVAVTDGEGRFKDVELIVGDEYTISAGAKGYQRTETPQFIATAETTKIETLILPDAGQFFIEGRITDTAGKPVHGAWVSTYAPQRQQSWNTHTDENGDYRLEILPMNVIDRLDIINRPKYAIHIFKGLKPTSVTTLCSSRQTDTSLVKLWRPMANRLRGQG